MKIYSVATPSLVYIVAANNKAEALEKFNYYDIAQDDSKRGKPVIEIITQSRK